MFFKIAEETVFKKVKAAKAAELGVFFNADTSIWRRGVDSEWRRHFTPEICAKVDAKMKM